MNSARPSGRLLHLERHAMADEAPKPAADPKPYDGYAGGSSTLDLATWTAAVKKCLGATRVETREIAVEGQPGKQKISVVAHETDPPEHFRATRKIPRPGPLPELVGLSSIPKGAKTVEHEHTVDVVHPHGGLDAVLHHIAHHAVSQARANQARQIALRDPVVGSPRDGLDPARHVTLPVVMVI